MVSQVDEHLLLIFPFSELSRKFLHIYVLPATNRIKDMPRIFVHEHVDETKTNLAKTLESLSVHDVSSGLVVKILK